MASRIALGNLSRTNAALFGVQQQLATGLSILRPSDDIVKAATIGTLDDRLDRSAQIQRNLAHADAAVSEMDDALAEAASIAEQARSIASSQVGITSSPTERAAQAAVVDGLLRGLFTTVNRQGVAGYTFGGTRGSEPPVRAFLGGYRYLPTGSGATSDLGLASAAPITLGDGNPVARTSVSVKGVVDFNPDLTGTTRLADLAGARGLGVTLGTVGVSYGGGPVEFIDLSGSDTIGDVALRLEAGLRRYESDHGVTVLGAGGVSVQGGSLSIAVAAGAQTLSFSEVSTGVTARDLGLHAEPPIAFSAASPLGADLSPRLTWRTPISALAGLGGPLGSIRISNAGQTAVVDLSTSVTLQDIRTAVEGTNLGVRVELNTGGDGLNFVNEISAASTNALSIGEVSGGTTATRLGVRTFSPLTRLSEFNFGAGVGIVNGLNDPSGGAASGNLNEDFVITLGDSAATRIAIDLRPEDVVTVQTLLDRINSQAASQLTAAGLPANSLVAGLATDGNGIRLSQSGLFPDPLRVEARNNSPAAGQIGLLSGWYDAGSASLIGEDRAKVRIDSLFTHLLDLRESLSGNDTAGIGLAGSGVSASLDEIAELRGVVGGHAQRIESATARESDRATLDETIRSGLRDSDYAQAATRFSLLQTQMEAGLRVTALSSQRTLLDFLG